MVSAGKKKKVNSLLITLSKGAHFGTTYPHLLFLNHSEFTPTSIQRTYQPRIFGFRVNESSPVGPRNQWLRKRYVREETINDNLSSTEDSTNSSTISSLNNLFHHWF